MSVAHLRRVVRDSSGHPTTFLRDLTINDAPVEVRNAWANPAAYGYPWTTNTGPVGALTPRSTGIVVTTDGDVIRGLDIASGIIVRASNVIIEDVACRKSTANGNYPIKMEGSADNLTVRRTRTRGGSVAVYSQAGKYTLDGCDIADCVDGPRIEQDGCTVTNTLVRQLVDTGGSHCDCIQIRGGRHTRLIHNTLQAYRPDTGDFRNGCLQYGSQLSDGGNYDDLWLIDSLLNGGNYSIMHDPAATNQRFTGNRFGRNYQFGLVKGGVNDDATWSMNVWDDTGALIPRP